MWDWIISALVLWGLFYLYLLRKDKKDLAKLIKNYDEEKDLSRGGEIDRGTKYGVGFYKEGKLCIKGLDKLEGRELLPTTDTNVSGEDSNSTGKPSKKFKGIFRKLRRQ